MAGIESFSTDKASGPGQYLLKSNLIDHFWTEGPVCSGEGPLEEERKGPEVGGPGRCRTGRVQDTQELATWSK